MSLSSTRVGSYTFGALAGAFGALALVAGRDSWPTPSRLLGLAAVCGLFSVALEERAQGGGS